MSRRKGKTSVLTALIIFVGLVSCTNQPQESFLIGAIPDQNPEKLNRQYKLLCAELSRELKVPVRYKPVTNYPAAVSAFRTGSLDLVWFGGL
ncbi:MAG TPA: PhnD/SsuA/transferrin family substrate-binding protein, partial [Prochlorococcus sp.]